ncbi:MAG: T9SS type A sorting domain-containing protein, partial [Candidatus Zophobacter franzmannii]|nr:T9SS type A sorting domain-containing protein [Candidatus Zophobacter franzmannii]
DGIFSAWTENTVGVGDIYMQKLDFAGNLDWATTGFDAIVKDSTQTSISMTQLGNQHYGVVWEDNVTFESDIFFNIYDYSGSPLLTTDGFMVSGAIKRQYTPKIGNIHNQQAMIVWSDGRSSGKTEIIGLYAQAMNCPEVANDDQDNPGVQGFKVAQNYPNPFNPTTTIEFNIPKSQNVEVTVFNILGQKVKTVAKDHFDAGINKIVWNGINENGKSVASGIYFYRVEAGKSSVTKKMVLMK